MSGYVHLGNERYGPFDPVPEDAARRITNPKAWVAGEVPQFVDSDTAEPGDEEPAAPTRRSTVPPPPRVGRGSGIEAWASFAEANDVDVPDGASRDEIIAACEDAGALDRS
ncbi:hypothetical protein I0C86_41455 [Plantactinospora sp. S1510]|uniref:Uncharacterized protein n=1 Tax=Plantactinospora alkalitolerans TaxID=2789879 RepID=A0ABS0HA16_9ACTN|nr:hypothetical protein [Plantactinospora alkalitolerans]